MVTRTLGHHLRTSVDLSGGSIAGRGLLYFKPQR